MTIAQLIEKMDGKYDEWEICEPNLMYKGWKTYGSPATVNGDASWITLDITSSEYANEEVGSYELMDKEQYMRQVDETGDCAFDDGAKILVILTTEESARTNQFEKGVSV